MIVKNIINGDNLEVSHYINQTIGSVNMNALPGKALTKIRVSPHPFDLIVLEWNIIELVSE